MEAKELKIITPSAAAAASPNVLVERVAMVADGDAAVTSLYSGRIVGEEKNDKGQVMPANVHDEMAPTTKNASWFLPGMPEASLSKDESDLLSGLY